MATKKLTRSNNRILAGVCGGIAEYFDVDATLVRICYAALSIFSAAFPGVILYIIMLLLMPEKDKNDNIPDAEVVE
jgi:phage shock protein C